MTTLTIALEEEELQQLQQIARQLGMRVEDLFRLSLGEYIARHQNFVKTVEQVLRKNDELYRRLAL